MRAEDVTSKIAGIGLRPSHGPPQTPSAQRQRLLLYLWRPGHVANRSEKDYVRGVPFHQQTQCKIASRALLRSTLPDSGTLASDREEPCSAEELLPAG